MVVFVLFTLTSRVPRKPLRRINLCVLCCQIVLQNVGKLLSGNLRALEYNFCELTCGQLIFLSANAIELNCVLGERDPNYITLCSRLSSMVSNYASWLTPWTPVVYRVSPLSMRSWRDCGTKAVRVPGRGKLLSAFILNLYGSWKRYWVVKRASGWAIPVVQVQFWSRNISTDKMCKNIVRFCSHSLFWTLGTCLFGHFFTIQYF
jgi:hypothetical protein